MGFQNGDSVKFEAYDTTGAAIDLPDPLSKTTLYTLGIATDATHAFTLTDASGTAVVPTAQSKGRLVMFKADAFSLPDLRGRTPIGAGQGEGLTLRALGIQGGDEEMQSHYHAISMVDASGSGTHHRVPEIYNYDPAHVPQPASAFTGTSGIGASGNMQPSLTLHHIIKT